MGIYENLPYTNYHELNADWIVKEVKRVAAEWVEYREGLDTWKSGVDDQLATFQTWFDNLDLTDETRSIIQEMVSSGQFITVTQPTITSAVESWLADHVTGSNAIDDTLTISGAAADAKVTGDRIADLKEDLDTISGDTDNLFTFKAGTFNGVTVSKTADGGLKLSGTCAGSINVQHDVEPIDGQYNLSVESDTAIESDSLYVYLRNAAGTPLNVINMSGTTQRATSTTAAGNPISKVDLTFINGKTYNCTLHIQLLTGLQPKAFISPYTAVDRIARNEIGYFLDTEISNESGYYKLDGTRQNATNYICKITDFIKTYEGCKYNYMGWGSASAYSVFFYDADKTLLSSLQYDSRNNYTEITVPADCEYVRFSSYHATGYQVLLDVQVVSLPDRIQNVPYSTGSAKSDYTASDLLTGKKWVALGDSFTHGDFSGVAAPLITEGRYIGQLAVYPFLIGGRKNMTINNMAVNGCTIAESGDSSVYALSRSGNYDSIPEDADYITIMIGINDSGKNIPIGTINDTSNTTFYGAWNTVLNWLRNNRPNAHVGIAISLSLHAEYRAAEIAIAKKYGYPFINLPEDETLPALLWASRAGIDASIQTLVNSQQRCSATNFHPNGETHKLLASIFENWLYSI